MTDNNHPITPPPELVERWAIKSPIQHSDETWAYELFIAHQAAHWGADQELEACISLMLEKGWMNQSFADNLRAARRPKPPSLKEQALELVDRIEKAESVWAMSELDIIRRALESLPD